MGLIYEVGDVVTLKKAHPCGSKEWEILRVGADFRLKCMGCGHQIMVARKLVEKNTRDLKKIEKIFKMRYNEPRQYGKTRGNGSGTERIHQNIYENIADRDQCEIHSFQSGSL